MKQESPEQRYRLDKWLWAARFFKTRSLAVDAIDSGKVRVDGDRAKAAKEVRLGMMIHIRTRDFEIELIVTGLSDIRRGAPEAATLYVETEESRVRQETAKLTQEADHAARDRGTGRPTKRELRDIKKFTQNW